MDQLLKKLQATALHPDQAQFYIMIMEYPKISALWNWENRTLNRKKFDQSIGYMSSGEQVLARFFEMVWLHEDKGFDLAEAASVLDTKERTMIAAWLMNPVWP